MNYFIDLLLANEILFEKILNSTRKEQFCRSKVETNE